MRSLACRAAALLMALGVAVFASVAPTNDQRFEHAGHEYTAPALAVDETGDTLLVGLVHDGSRDQLCGWFGTQTGKWGERVEIASASALLPPSVAAVPGGGFVVCWSALVDGDWDVFIATSEAPGFSSPERIHARAGADTEQALAVAPDGTVWVAWQGVQGARTEIFTAHRQEGDPWVRGMATENEASDLHPSLAIDARGDAWIAWSSWRHGTYADGNYEVYAARMDALESAQRVTNSSAADLAPALVACGEELVLVWTESYFPTRRNDVLTTVGYDRWADKVYRVTWSEEGEFGPSTELRLADNSKQGTTLSDRAFPIAAPDGKHVYVAYGELGGVPAPEFETRLTVVGPGGASEPQAVSATVLGPARRMGLAWRGEELLCAQVGQTGPAGAQVQPFLEVTSVSVLPDPTLSPLRPRAAAERKPPARGLFADQPTRKSRTTRDQDGTQLTAWFGNLHLHSDLSRDARGFEGSPAMNFQLVYDLAGLDFAGLSDHAEALLPGDWWEVRKVSDLWNRPGVFVTLPGYEWTSLSYGHRNVFFPDTLEADADATFGALGPEGERTPADLWRYLDERRALTIPHHVSHALSKPTDWSYRNGQFERLVEIFQVRGNYEYDGAPYQKRDTQVEFVPGHSVQSALDCGLILGIIASPDHGGGMGLAGVWSEELTRESIFEALHARRTFGTTGAKMDLFLEVAGVPMGKGRPGDWESPLVRATVHGTVPGLEAVLVRDGVEVHSWQTDDATLEIEWADSGAPSGGGYWYLRAEQSDGHIGWTSPVWLAGWDH